MDGSVHLGRLHGTERVRVQLKNKYIVGFCVKPPTERSAPLSPPVCRKEDTETIEGIGVTLDVGRVVYLPLVYLTRVDTGHPEPSRYHVECRRV